MLEKNICFAEMPSCPIYLQNVFSWVPMKLHLCEKTKPRSAVIGRPKNAWQKSPVVYYLRPVSIYCRHPSFNVIPPSFSLAVSPKRKRRRRKLRRRARRMEEEEAKEGFPGRAAEEGRRAEGKRIRPREEEEEERNRVRDPTIT